MFQAGVDGLETDALGRLCLSQNAMRQRNQMVFNAVLSASIPCVVFMGGGYSKPIGPTVDAFYDLFFDAARANQQRLEDERKGVSSRDVEARTSRGGFVKGAKPMNEPTCARCGRIMKPRKNWDRQSEPVKYCSKQCRRLRLRPIDRQLESAMLELLAERPGSSSICPSEVAQSVRPASWKDILEPSRMAARRLVAQGRVEIVQGALGWNTAKGPFRIRRSSAFSV